MDKLSQLPILIVFLAQALLQLCILLLHLCDHGIALLELLLDYLELLGVSKGVLRPNHFFKLMAQAHTLLHVELDLNLELLLAR